MRLPLIDGQGNFGSVDGDAPAAMRYTECRLTPIAHALLSELREQTVDYRPNYASTAEEPIVLPAQFTNLLVNGLKYTLSEGTVRMRWWSDEEGAYFSVIDTGIGIPAEHIPRLTERFYRVDAGRSRGEGGSGLGLAIVKHALQRHGGWLDVRSVEGKGSTFTCHFPAQRVCHLDVAASA